MDKREFWVDTPVGNLHVIASADQYSNTMGDDSKVEYPGVIVLLESRESDREEILACIEYTHDDGKLEAGIYGDVKSDDPTDVISFDIPKAIFDPAWEERVEKLAQEIIEFIRKNELGGDLLLYYNGKCVTVDEDGLTITEDGVDPRDCFDYVNQPNILSMSFEGVFYEVMNDPRFDKLEVEFSGILNKYGLYYELGNAWNLSVCEQQ